MDIQKGFTLLELMITIAIVGILAAIAIPSYQDYARRASYSEIVMQAAPYKLGVMSCYQILGDFAGCNAGTNDIPPAVTGGIAMVARVEVVAGKITITPNDKKGIQSTDTYILTPQPPTESSNAVTWTSTGGGVEKGYAK
jgi:type IV pilus assembly protein PilA